eukprot:Hpha_TRINITY_DN17211_c0_g1::TRINITY_DN17211_c0_g1_i1::g.17911::m.17911/K18163/NDUFAF6; NADH dehydrogenase [ubiquinone] 1 alpha subcomplex assembly factor 6
MRSVFGRSCRPVSAFRASRLLSVPSKGGGQKPVLRAVKKGAFDISKGGLSALAGAKPTPEKLASMAQTPGEPEAIDFSAHAQPVMQRFEGATAVDWEETRDLMLSRDTWWRHYISMWDKRLKDPDKTNGFVALTALLLQMYDVYLVNPYRRFQSSTPVLHASGDIRNKTLRAGWWQEAVKKVVLRNQVESVPHLKALAATLNKHDLTRFHVRNMSNTFCRLCTLRQPQSIDEFLRDADQIWGSYLYLQLELMGETREDAVIAASHLGKAMGCAFALQSLVHSRFTKCTLVPADLMAKHNTDLDRFITRQYTPGQVAVVEQMLSVMLSEMTLARDRAVPLGYMGGMQFRRMILHLPLCELEAYARVLLRNNYNITPESPLVEDAQESQLQFFRRQRVLIKKFTGRLLLGGA